ncbi:MAG: DUF2442 domain-containing protein [bacterium]
MAGKNTFHVEVLNISKHGFWLLVHQKEYFLPFSTFPWFKNANISSILNVKLLQFHHLYWPDLDVDLEIESIESPEKYPLVYT